MRILQICYGNIPREAARVGIEVRYWQNMASLLALGHELHLIVCCAEEEIEPEIRHKLGSIHYVNGAKRATTRFESWRSLVDDKAALQFFLPQIRGLHGEISKFAARIRPDLILADWFGSLALAPHHFPVVYSHHDFYYKVRFIRNKIKNQQIQWPERRRLKKLQQVEQALCSKAAHIISVSALEKEELARVAKHASYIPIVGPTIPRPNGKLAKKGRIFLFGAMPATPMRYAVRHLREKIWPLLEKDMPDVEWHHVGKPETQDTDDWIWMKTNFICHGFVDDLSKEFCPGDACLTPYIEDNGFRTHFVTAAAYGVINIGYESTFLCAPEFTDKKDCLIIRSPAELVDSLRLYAHDAKLRYDLGEASRALYQSAFSFEAQLPKYELAIRQVG
jgi:glycosyltransferase involved in cell wall biosynthesis